jgi:putative ABC transport system permease protein
MSPTKKEYTGPPALPERIIQRLAWAEDRFSIQENLREEFRNISTQKGLRSANLWYWRHMIRSIFPFLKFSIYWNYIMFKNYLKVAVRNLKKYKVYSFINIFGLATGLACSIFVFLYIFNEISYDKFHEKFDQIYRVYVKARIDNRTIETLGTSAPLAQTLKDEYPELLQALRVSAYRDSPSRKAVIHLDDKTFEENNVYTVDPNFFEVFSFSLISGDPHSVLSQPHTAVLTEATARKYFRSDNPIGKTLTIDGKECQVTGLTEDVPINSHFHFDILVSSRTFEWGTGTEWLSSRCLTYVVLNKNQAPEVLESRFPGFVDKYLGEGGEKFHWSYWLQPLKDVHLHSNLGDEFEVNGNIVYVYVFSIIALFILIIASINFMNLATAKYSSRIREIGVRKVVGSTKEQLVKQFLGESILLSFISLFAALVLVQLLFPAYRNLIGLDLNLNFFNNPYVIPALAGLALLVGILSGSYPAFFLSSFKPAEILKARNLPGAKNRSVLLRNWLIVFQFAVSVLLIIGTVVVYKQLRYIQNKDLGFDQEQVLVLKNIHLLNNQKEAFKNKVLQHPGIMSASVCSAVPSTSFNSWAVIPEGKTADEWTTLRFCVGDHDYFDTLGLELVEGRLFSKDLGTDVDAAVLNEEAVKVLGWENPIGKKFKRGRKIHSVIGIVKDFHFESMHKKVQKLAVVLSSPSYEFFRRLVAVKIRPDNFRATLDHIDSVWNSFSLELPLEFSFLDQDLDSLYRSEQKTGSILLLFVFMAVVIASLGLLGLMAFVINRRTKEIGIRKILGANNLSVMVSLVREFVTLVLLANIIAWPFGWYAMQKWLENFAYNTTIGIEVFVLTASLSLVTAVVTIGYQVLKALRANPVDSLRYE